MPFPADFDVVARQDGDVFVVAPTGEVDIATSVKVREGFDRHDGGTLAFDLRGVGFIDSAGLQLVVEQFRKAEAEGFDFVIVRGPEQVQQLFEIAGLADRLSFVDDPAEIVTDDQARDA